MFARGDSLIVLNGERLSKLTDSDGDGIYDAVVHLTEALPVGQASRLASNGIVQAPDGRLFSANLDSGEISADRPEAVSSTKRCRRPIAEYEFQCAGANACLCNVSESRNIIRRTMDLQKSARFEIAISAAVVASIVIMALETFDLPPRLLQALFVADVALSLLFVAEYLFRLATAEDKLDYAKSFYGIVDLVALLPILVHAAGSVRVARLLRVLRIVRLLKLKRYNDALERYRLALTSNCGGGGAFRRRSIRLHRRLRLPDLRGRA